MSQYESHPQSPLHIYGMNTKFLSDAIDAHPGADVFPDEPAGGGPTISMDTLYPTLIQCFAIIICG